MTYFREAVVNTQEMLDLLARSQRLYLKLRRRRLHDVTPPRRRRRGRESVLSRARNIPRAGQVREQDPN